MAPTCWRSCMNPIHTPPSLDPSSHRQRSAAPQAPSHGRLLLAGWPAMVLGATLAATVLTACGPDDSVLASAPDRAGSGGRCCPGRPRAGGGGARPGRLRHGGRPQVQPRPHQLDRTHPPAAIGHHRRGGGRGGGGRDRQPDRQRHAAVRPPPWPVGWAAPCWATASSAAARKTSSATRCMSRWTTAATAAFSREQLNGLDVGTRVRVDGKRMRVL